MKTTIENWCSPSSSFLNTILHSMGQIRSKQLYEAEKLLKEIESWSEEEIESLPRLYREKAREYQGLVQQGEE